MIVVADTSVIVNLVRVGHDQLLRRIYHEAGFWISEKLRKEVLKRAGEIA